MKVTLTGATGAIGTKLIAELKARGDEVTLLSRNPDKAHESVGAGWDVVEWDPNAGPAPRAALDGRDAIVHLAGEPVAQRWNAKVKERILSSREVGTRNLVAGIAAADPQPKVLVSSSAVGYYGPHGDEPLTEDTPAGSDFLADVCRIWEREADKASELGLRVVKVRTGVVLDPNGGALKTMLPPFKLGGGGPVAGGGQYMPWIHVDDIVGIYLRALDDGDWSGPVNATAPTPVTNKVFSKALGKVLKRPAIAPIPALAIKALYGEMADIVTKGQRVLPQRTVSLGYDFRHPDLDEALRSALGREDR